MKHSQRHDHRQLILPARLPRSGNSFSLKRLVRHNLTSSPDITNDFVVHAIPVGMFGGSDLLQWPCHRRLGRWYEGDPFEGSNLVIAETRPPVPRYPLGRRMGPAESIIMTPNIFEIYQRRCKQCGDSTKRHRDIRDFVKRDNWSQNMGSI